MIKGITISLVLVFALTGSVYSQSMGFLAGNTTPGCPEVSEAYGVNARSECLLNASYSWNIQGASSYTFNSGNRGVNIKWPNNNNAKSVSVTVTYGSGCSVPYETFNMTVVLAHTVDPLPTLSGLTPSSTKVCAGGNVTLETFPSFDPNADGDTYNNITYVWSYSKDGAARVNLPSTTTKTTNFTLPAFSTGGSIVFYVYAYNTSCPNYRTSEVQSASQPVLDPAPSAPDLRLCLDGGSGTLSLVNVPGGSGGEQYYINIQDVGGFGPIGAGSVIGTIGSYSAKAYQFYRYANRPASGNEGCLVSGTTPGANAYSLTVGGSANCNGGLDATVSGGTATYSYSVNGGTSYQAGTAFNGLGAGSYTVKVKDVYGCVGTSPSAVTVFNAVSQNVVPKLACPGLSDGTITINASGGQGPFQYSINNGTTVSTTNVFPTLAAGTYNLYIKDLNGVGCTSTQSYTLGNSPALNITSVTPTHPRCPGESSGSFIVTASGGTGAFEYSRGSGFQSSSTFSTLPAGSYTVTVRDGNSCTKSYSPVVLTNPTAITFTSMVVKPRSCAEKTDGVVEVTASGGTGTRTYSLDNSNYVAEGTPTRFTGLASGVYTVYVKDGNGCIVPNSTSFLDVLPAINGNLTVEKVISCFGRNDGILKTSPTGGTAPYTILWSNTVASAQNPNLGPGTYSVDITDSKGCIKSFSRTLTEPAVLNAQPVLSNYNGYGVRCSGGSDGSIDLTVTGGTTPYTYAWSNGSNTQDLSGLPPGSFNVTVTDAHGCSVPLANLAITAPSAISASVARQKNILCKSEANGALEIGAGGGAGSYEYSLNGTTWQNVSLFDGLTAGTYTAHVRDANLCSATRGATLTEPPVLVLNLTDVVNTNCGAANGSATISASGGVAGYRYEWRDSGNALISTSNQVATIASGTYRAYVYDANSCNTNIPVTINDSDGPKIQQQSITALTCFESNDGAIAVTITEGQAPYAITWDTQAQGVTSVSNVTGGEHWVEVVDGGGCRVRKTFRVDFPPALALTLDALDPLCKGNTNGRITASATGGNPGGYNYQWSSGQTSASISGLAAGTYSLTVKDSKQCTLQREVVLTDPPQFVIDAGGDRAICVGQTLRITAPVDNAIYAWSSDAGFSSTSRDVTISAPAKYTLKVVNANGCEAEDSFVVTTSNDLLQADFLAAPEAYAGDTVVLIEISWPVPDQISWRFPPEARVINQYEAYAEVVFDNPGIYNIVLDTHLGECIDDYSKSITIMEGQRPDEGGRKASSLVSRFEVHPNPSNGRFEVSIGLTEAVPGKLVMTGATGNSQPLFILFDGKTEHVYNVALQDVSAGLYFLILEVGKKKEVKRLIIR